MLTEWFTVNQQSRDGHDLTYCDFPTRYTWDATKKIWNKRTHGHKIERLYYINPMEVLWKESDFIYECY
uniref:Uncharacterized protein n=1 Tax=Arundo donax TaxID=35708 RepID=A0A0A8XUA1_ARUDO